MVVLEKRAGTLFEEEPIETAREEFSIPPERSFGEESQAERPLEGLLPERFKAARDDTLPCPSNQIQIEEEIVEGGQDRPGDLVR